MIRPLGERVLVEPLEQEQTTSIRDRTPGLPPKKNRKKVESLQLVLELLKDGVRVALEVKEGDRVIFSKYAGTEIKYRR